MPGVLYIKHHRPTLPPNVHAHISVIHGGVESGIAKPGKRWPDRMIRYHMPSADHANMAAKDLRRAGYTAIGFDTVKESRFLESMRTAALLHDMGAVLERGMTSVFKKDWDAPRLSLESAGKVHGFEVKAHPKGGHVALIPKTKYKIIKKNLGVHHATEFGDHMRVRTAGKPMGESYVMVPHSQLSKEGVQRRLTTWNALSPHRAGTLHPKDFTKHGNDEKHHAVHFSANKHAHLFAQSLENEGKTGHSVAESDNASREFPVRAAPSAATPGHEEVRVGYSQNWTRMGHNMHVHIHNTFGAKYQRRDNETGEDVYHCADHEKAHQAANYLHGRGYAVSVGPKTHPTARAGHDDAAVQESIGKGHWRQKGGKFASVKTKGGAHWHPNVPKAFRERIEKMGGKVKSSGTAGGMALVFKDASKCEEAFRLLVLEGIKVDKHDIPGVLFVNHMISEAVDPAELAAGIEDEKDHTSPEQLKSLAKKSPTAAARQIALDHLKKSDPHYYSKIKAAGLMDEDFTQVHSDEEDAEDEAQRRSSEEGGAFAVLCFDDGTCIVLPFNDATARPQANLHAVYQDGEPTIDPDDEDEDIEERFSFRSTALGKLSRKKMKLGHLSRAKNARQSFRARLRRGAVYAARKKARTALHRPTHLLARLNRV